MPKAIPISILLLPGWVVGPKALPTDKGLDRRKLIEVFQKLMQGVSVAWRDGVLVLEQELDGAREESEGACKERGSEGRLGTRQCAPCTREGTAKVWGWGKDKQWRSCRTWILRLLKKEKFKKARRSCAGSGKQRSMMKRGRKPRGWEQKQGLLSSRLILCPHLVRVDELPHRDIDDWFGHRHHLRVFIHVKPLLWLGNTAGSGDEPPTERDPFGQPPKPACSHPPTPMPT